MAEEREGDDRVVSLIDDAVAGHLALRSSSGRAARSHRRRVETAVDALVDLDGLEGAGVHRPERLLGARLHSVLAGLRDRNWKPAELAHVVRRRHPDPRLVNLLEALMAAPTDRASAADGDAAVVEWRRSEGIDPVTAIECAVELVSALVHLPPLDPVGEPPSLTTEQSGTAPGDRSTGAGAPASQQPAPRALATIRGLLAKAESTSFPAEAETFAAKAQELMTRHSIDATLVAAAAAAAVRGHGSGAPPNDWLTTSVGVRRVPIDDPYGAEKASLLHVVASLNDVRTVWDDQLGLATIVGFPADLDLVELLFTSLLVQATRAVNDPSNAAPDRRAPSFRRAFLLAYADRIGERLRQARDRAGREAVVEHGPTLTPVLAARRAAVDAVADARHPDARPGRVRLVDARGWAAGGDAADRAHLHP